MITLINQNKTFNNYNLKLILKYAMKINDNIVNRVNQDDKYLAIMNT